MDVRQLADRWAHLPRDEQIRRLRRTATAWPVADRFRLLHALGLYAHPEAVSGPGSTLAETAALRAALPGLLRRERVASLLDLACGDAHWMARVPLGDVTYLGVDVVPELVDVNRARETRPGYRFDGLDATAAPLPRADLVLCRDLLPHLSLADVAAVLRNVVASGARLLLASHFANATRNAEVTSGDFRPVHLGRPPFNLPPPRLVISEQSRLGDGRFADRGMALWDVADVTRAIG